jgi:hypothetical protein
MKNGKEREEEGRDRKEPMIKKYVVISNIIIIIIIIIIKSDYFFWLCSPARAMTSSFTRFLAHTTMTHHSRQDSSGLVTSSSQRPLPDNTKHTQQTKFHAPGGIRTHDRSRRAAVDLRLRPRRLLYRPITSNTI